MKQEIALKHEFVQFIPEELTGGDGLHLYPLCHGLASLRLRLQNQGGHAAEADRLETDFRRQDDFARSLDRELEFSVPLALLDQEQQGAMGRGLVSVADRREQDLRSPRERGIFRHREG